MLKRSKAKFKKLIDLEWVELGVVYFTKVGSLQPGSNTLHCKFMTDER